jgi:hypothetical protein
MLKCRPVYHYSSSLYASSATLTQTKEGLFLKDYPVTFRNEKSIKILSFYVYIITDKADF